MEDKPTVGQVQTAQNAVRSAQALGKGGQLLKPIPQGQVAVVNPVGQVVLIDEAQAQEAYKQGYRSAATEEVRQQQVHELYGDTASQLATGALGALDTATFGFGPGLLYKGAQIIGGQPAADAARTNMQLMQGENPGSYMLGQGVGVFVPALATGGESLLGEGLAVGAEKAVAGQIGKGALSTAAKWATQGAFDAAVYGVGNSTSEAMLGDEKLTAEKLAASAAKNALWGAAIGGGMGLVGGTVSKLGGMFGKMPSLESMGADLMQAGLGADARTLRMWEAAGIDKMRVYNFMMEHPELNAWASRGSKLEELPAILDPIRSQYAQDIEKAIGGIDAAAETAGYEADAVGTFKYAHEKIVKPLEESPWHFDIARRTNKFIESYGEKLGVYRRNEMGEIITDEITGLPKIFESKKLSYKELHTFRKKLDDIVFREGKALSTDAVVNELQDLRRIMEDEFRRQLTGGIPNLGRSEVEVNQARKSWNAYTKTPEYEKIVETKPKAVAPQWRDFADRWIQDVKDGESFSLSEAKKLLEDLGLPKKNIDELVMSIDRVIRDDKQFNKDLLEKVLKDADKHPTKLPSVPLAVAEDASGKPMFKSRHVEVDHSGHLKGGYWVFDPATYEMHSVASLADVKAGKIIAHEDDINAGLTAFSGKAKKTPTVTNPFENTSKFTSDIQAMVGKTESGLEASIDKTSLAKQQAAQKAFKESGQAYIDATEKYKLAAQIQQGVERNLPRLEARQPMGLLNTMYGLGGMLAFGPKGLAVGIGAKLLRERGPQFFAAALYKANHLAALKGATNAVTDAVAKGAKAALKSTPRAAIALSGSREKQAKKAMARVAELASKPEEVQELIKDHIDGTVAQNVQREYINTVIRNIQYMNATMPKGSLIVPALPGTARTQPNKTAVNSWLRQFDVFNDPVASIFAALRKGQLTRDHVEAADAMYPLLMNEIRTQVVGAFAEAAHNGKTPSYGQRLQMGLLLRAEMDASLDPEFIKTQQNISQIPPDEGEPYEQAQGGRVQPRNKQRASIGSGEEELNE